MLKLNEDYVSAHEDHSTWVLRNYAGLVDKFQRYGPYDPCMLIKEISNDIFTSERKMLELSKVCEHIEEFTEDEDITSICIDPTDYIFIYDFVLEGDDTFCTQPLCLLWIPICKDIYGGNKMIPLDLNRPLDEVKKMVFDNYDEWR